jgi:hypothetical protein
MADVKAAVSTRQDWHLYLPPNDDPPQPYCSEPTTWPLSNLHLERLEDSAKAGDPLALNLLGTDHFHFWF